MKLALQHYPSVAGIENHVPQPVERRQRCCYEPVSFHDLRGPVLSRLVWIVTHISRGVQEKIKKLLDIWEKGQTFPMPMIESFKEKLNAPPQSTLSLGQHHVRVKTLTLLLCCLRRISHLTVVTRRRIDNSPR